MRFILLSSLLLSFAAEAQTYSGIANDRDFDYSCSKSAAILVSTLPDDRGPAGHFPSFGFTKIRRTVETNRTNTCELEIDTSLSPANVRRTTFAVKTSSDGAYSHKGPQPGCYGLAERFSIGIALAECAKGTSTDNSGLTRFFRPLYSKFVDAKFFYEGGNETCQIQREVTCALYASQYQNTFKGTGASREAACKAAGDAGVAATAKICAADYLGAPNGEPTISNVEAFYVESKGGWECRASVKSRCFAE